MHSVNSSKLPINRGQHPIFLEEARACLNTLTQSPGCQSCLKDIKWPEEKSFRCKGKIEKGALLCLNPSLTPEIHFQPTHILVLHLKTFFPHFKALSTFQLLDSHEITFNVTHQYCCQNSFCSPSTLADLAGVRAALPLSTLLQHCSRHKHWFSLPCSCQQSLGEWEKSSFLRNAKWLLKRKPDTSKLFLSVIEEMIFHTIN